MKTQHTPTPWHVEYDEGCRIAAKPFSDSSTQVVVMADAIYGNEKANAAFIVRAANCHEIFEQALTAIAMDAFMEPKKAWAIAQAALSLARGETP